MPGPRTLRAAALAALLAAAPAPAAAVREVPVPIPSAGGVTLAGALTVPDGPGPHPAVVLVSGLGPNDRDGVVIPGVADRVYGDWARALTRRGVAVLRYDKRGIGRSPGPPLAWLDLRLLRADAAAAVRALARRPEAARGRIGVVGHSQGGDIALWAGRAAGARRVVTLAAPGRPLGSLRAGADPLLAALVGRAAARATLAADPRRDAARLPAPLLVVQGTADRVVPPADAGRLARARRAAGRPVRVLVVPRADHFLAVAGRVPPAVWARVARFARG
jgi:hypothetical protein